MKNFNCMIFLLSFAMVGISAMEIDSTKWVVHASKKRAELFAEGTISYGDEYKVDEFAEKVLSFPGECTDPLPIEYCGNQRFFFTSANPWLNGIMQGEVFTILDPAIKQLAVVRGDVQNKDGNVGRINVYLGLKTDHVKFEDDIRIFPAIVMVSQAIMVKNDNKKCEHYYHLVHNRNRAEIFDGLLLMEELKKQSPHIEICAQTAHLVKPLVKDLLGKKNAQHFDFKNQQFNFKKVYWTEKENKLKGITYNFEDTK